VTVDTVSIGLSHEDSPMSELRERAENYLRGPHVLSRTGTACVSLVTRYVAGGPWDAPALRAVLDRSVLAARGETAARDGGVPGPETDARSFFLQSAELLDGIRAEVFASPE
jgi:hypothetical protein